MTGLLHDVLHDRAEHLPATDLDVQALVRAGDRRVARRRTTFAGAGVAAALALGLAGPALLTDLPRHHDVATAATPGGAIAYARGSTIHVDGRTIDVGHPVRALVQGPSGFVVTDPDGTVLAVTDGRVLEVGTLSDAPNPRLESDGDVVAWVEGSQAGGEQFAVLDLATGSGVVRSPVARTGVELADATSATIAAVDGRTVYLADRRGVVAWDALDSGRTRLLAAQQDQEVEVYDVEDGVFSYHAMDGAPTHKVDQHLVGNGLRSPMWVVDTWDGDLSPSGRYLISDTDDVNAVFDNTTGKQLPFDKGDYAYLVGYRWLDDDTYAGLGLRTTDSTEPDLFTCEVATGSCTLAVEHAGSGGDLVLPVGEGW